MSQTHFIFRFDLLNKEPAIKSTLPLSVSTADVRKTPLRLNMSRSNSLRLPVSIETMCQSDRLKKGSIGAGCAGMTVLAA